ncbi:histamine N-methyltransferase-like [Saccoglossus kowalevskii]
MARLSANLFNYLDEYHLSFQTLLDNGLKSRECRYKEDAIQMIGKLDLESRSEVRVLSIGSGNGDVDFHFINALVDKYTAIHYTVVEPANGPIDKFKRLIESNKDKWNGVNFTFHVQEVEEYLEEGGTSDKYDVIHACHSLYRFRDAENTLRYLYNILSMEGMLLIRVIKDESHSRYQTLLDNGLKSRECRYREDAIKMIGKLDLESRNEVRVLSILLDPAMVGNRMLDFLTVVLNFRNSRPPDEVEDCLRYFRDECCYVKANEIMFDYAEEDIIIWRKQHAQ